MSFSSGYREWRNSSLHLAGIHKDLRLQTVAYFEHGHASVEQPTRKATRLIPVP